MTRKPIRFYRDVLSAPSHRVEMLLALLDIPFLAVDADASHTSRFGPVPVIEDGELVLADPSAILVYLARRYGEGRWMPEDAAGFDRIKHWLSVASSEKPAHVRELRDLLDRALEGKGFLVAGHATIADLACYVSIARGREIDVSSRVRAWMSRIEALPRFLPLLAAAPGVHAA